MRAAVVTTCACLALVEVERAQAPVEAAQDGLVDAGDAAAEAATEFRHSRP